MSSYINHTLSGPNRRTVHDWEDFTHKRLFWLYGPDRAWAIHKGTDLATQSDLARWNSLGRRDAA